MDPLEFPTVLALDFPFSLSCSRLPSYGGWRERERENETAVKEQRKVKVERVLLPRLQ